MILFLFLDACWRAYLAFRHSRAFPDGPSLSSPGRAIFSMARRLTMGMAERILAIFGEGRSYNTTSYTYRPPAVPLEETLLKVASRLATDHLSTSARCIRTDYKVRP